MRVPNSHRQDQRPFQFRYFSSQCDHISIDFLSGSSTNNATSKNPFNNLFLLENSDFNVGMSTIKKSLFRKAWEVKHTNPDSVFLYSNN